VRWKMLAGVFALAVFGATGVPARGQTSSPQKAQGQTSTSQDSSTQGSDDSKTPRSIRVDANVEQANLVHQVTPVYPEIAKAAHITGAVLLHAIIGKDGTVQDLQYVSGPPLLMKAAMDAVRQWRYKPTLLNGSPIEVDTTISVVFTLGGSNDAQPGQPEPTQRPLGTNGAADSSQEPVVYEYIHQNLRYENDGSGRRETHGKIRVQTSAGLARAGQLVFEYNAANEKIEISSVRVEKPDGTIVNAGPESVQDLTAPVARQAPVYTDAREKHVTVPSLSVGDAIEYDVVINSTPVMAGQFWNTVYFSSYVACLDEQVDLDVPGDRKIAYSNTPSTTEFSTRDAGDRRIYHWKAAATTIPKMNLPSNGPGFDLKKVLEGNRPPLPPHIFFSTFQSWSEVGKWYAGLVRDRRIPTPEIRARADEIVRGKTSELEKAEALYSWVAANIRYVSLSFGVGWYQPHSATEVLANRYGDCKDKSTLLDAFFAAEGLNAHSALIDSRADLDEGVPSPGQFDHAITYARVEGKDIWLDSTLGVGPFGYLLPQLRGKRALVVTEDSVPELQKTFDTLPTPSVYRMEVEGEVNKDAKLEAKVSFITRGDLEVLYRILYSSLSASQFNAIAAMPLADSLKATYASKLSDFVVEDVADTSKPLHMRFQFVGDLTYVDMKSTSRQAFLAALIKALFQKDGLLALLPGAQSTMSDFAKIKTAKLVGDKEYSLTITIKVPTLKTDDTENPQATHIAAGASEYDASSHWDGQTLRANWELALRISETSEARAKEYAEFCKGVIRSLNDDTPKETKSASGGKSDSPKVTAHAVDGGVRPYAEEVHNLYEQGLAESKQQNYANAIESFTSALKLDPEYVDGWRELGRAQMYLRNYTDADTDFRKYLALAPEDHLAYLNMAWVLYNEKKFNEDVELLEKRISNSPNDGDANSRLGRLIWRCISRRRPFPISKRPSRFSRSMSLHSLV
jgi:TonB family protein